MVGGVVEIYRMSEFGHCKMTQPQQTAAVSYRPCKLSSSTRMKGRNKIESHLFPVHKSPLEDTCDRREYERIDD